MKKSLLSSIVYASYAIIFVACQKADLLKEPGLKAHPSTLSSAGCLASSLSFAAEDFPAQTIFNTRFVGSSLQVDAGIFSGGTIASTLPLTVQWSGQTILFSKTGSPSEVVLIAYLDKKGRIEKILPGNTPNEQFLPTSFEYKKNKLSAMHITLAGTVTTSNFSYDQRGNVTSIIDLPLQGAPSPGSVIYKYSNTLKATQQFYLDEPRKFSWNSFTLLQYIGLFPELQPVNLRTYAKMIWGDNYVAYDVNIANHQVDGQGNLTGYDIVSPITGGTVFSYKVTWSCAAGGGNNEQVQ